jgi:hypothetical protein
MTDAVKVFVSYSHQDAEYLKDDSLLGFLKGLGKDGVEFWDDRRIRPGELWDEVIKANLQEARIALVLVSQFFLDSAYCQNVEIEHCLARKTHLFPIILSPCDWRRHDWLSNRQFLPGGDQTVEEHYTEPGRRKRLFLEIRERLRERVELVRKQEPPPPPPPPLPDPPVFPVPLPNHPFPVRPRLPCVIASAMTGVNWPILLRSRPPIKAVSNGATKPGASGSGWKTADVWGNYRKD